MYLSWDPSDLAQLRARLLGLRNAVKSARVLALNEEDDLLQVHFVSIEIGIIRGCPADQRSTGRTQVRCLALHREVETES